MYSHALKNIKFLTRILHTYGNDWVIEDFNLFATALVIFPRVG